VSSIEANVTGVYATVHTTAGDIATGPPTRVDIDCESLLFYLPIEWAPFDGTIETVTLHLGTMNATLPGGNISFREGSSVTVVSPVLIGDLSHSDGPPPAWMRRR
jgi:hypothetical protein